jgi:hypothetical protein
MSSVVEKRSRAARYYKNKLEPNLARMEGVEFFPIFVIIILLFLVTLHENSL